jgi:thioredoxin-related protein
MVQSVMRHRIWVATVGLTVTLALCGGCGPSGSAKSKPAITTVATFLQEHGLEGHVVLLQFGTTAGCQLSADGLAKMTALHQDLRFAAVSLVRVEMAAESPAATKYFAVQTPGFPVYYDPDMLTGRAFQATVFPTFVLVDKFGRVRYRGPWTDENKLAAWTAELAAQTADAGPQAALFGAVSLDVPKLLADTNLPDLQGAAKPLHDYLGKNGLAAIFVDTRCPFSETALKDVPLVAPVLAAHDLPTVIINVGDAKSAVQSYYNNRGLSLPVVYDETAATQQKWQVTSVPTVFLIDAAGQIAYRGPAAWKDVAGAADGMLKLSCGTITFPVGGTSMG